MIARALFSNTFELPCLAIRSDAFCAAWGLFTILSIVSPDTPESPEPRPFNKRPTIAVVGRTKAAPTTGIPAPTPVARPGVNGFS